MSSIGSVSPAASLPVKTSQTSSSLPIDQAASTAAQAVADKATAQLAADQKARAAAAVITVDEQSVTTDNAAAAKAAAKVAADQSGGGGLDILV